MNSHQSFNKWCTHNSKKIERVCVYRTKTTDWSTFLEVLLVDNGGTKLITLLLGNPHLVEGGCAGHETATDPGTVFALRRGDDLDLHSGWGQDSDLLL